MSIGKIQDPRTGSADLVAGKGNPEEKARNTIDRLNEEVKQTEISPCQCKAILAYLLFQAISDTSQDR